MIQDRLDRMEQPDSRDQGDQTALLVLRDPVAQPELRDHKASPDLEAIRDSAANKVLRVPQEMLDQPDPRVSKVNLVWRELADCPETLGHRVRLDPKEIAGLQASLEQKVRGVTLELPVFPEFKVCRDLQAHWVQLDCRGQLVEGGILVPLVHRVKGVRVALSVWRAPLARPDRLDPRDFVVIRESLARKEIQV